MNVSRISCFGSSVVNTPDLTPPPDTGRKGDQGVKGGSKENVTDSL